MLSFILYASILTLIKGVPNYEYSIETWDATTGIQEAIGWKKIFECYEFGVTGNAQFTQHVSNFLSYMESAYTFRIMTQDGDNKVVIKPGTNSMNKINNGYVPETNYDDSAAINDWIGTSTDIDALKIYATSSPLLGGQFGVDHGEYKVYYWAPGNSYGMTIGQHVVPADNINNKYCRWDFQTVSTDIIEIYVGYKLDINQVMDDITTEIWNTAKGIQETIGWIKILSCTEGSNPIFTNHISDFEDLIQAAYSFRIIPKGYLKTDPKYNELAVVMNGEPSILKVGLNSGKVPETKSGEENIYWIGSSQARNRLIINTPLHPVLGGDFGGVKNGYKVYYWAAGNNGGIQIAEATINGQNSYCYWDQSPNLQGADIEIYFGYKLDFSGVFDDETIESWETGTGITERIGWTKILSCPESTSSLFTHHVTEFYNAFTPSTSLMGSAYSFRITPPGGKSNSNYAALAVAVKPGTTAMARVNAGLVPEAKYAPPSIDGTVDWIGTNDAKVGIRITEVSASLLDGSFGGTDNVAGRLVYYWSTGNTQGMVIGDFDGNDQYGLCYWDGTNYPAGEDIEIYLGYQIKSYDIPSDLTDCVNHNRIHAWYKADEMGNINNQWQDISNNNNHATITGLYNIESWPNSKKYVTGTTSTNITFPVNLHQTDHTVFSLTKYNGNNGIRKRILQTTEDNGLFGHWGGLAGQAYAEGYITDLATDRFGALWYVILCLEDGYNRLMNIQGFRISTKESLSG